MCSHTKFLECETECACSVPGYLQCALERGIAFPCVQQERLSLQGYCTDRRRRAAPRTQQCRWHTLAHTGTCIGTHWHTNQTAHSTSTSHIDVHCSTLHTRSSLLTGQWTPTECTSHTTHDPLLVNITHVPQKHTRPYIHTQV